MCPRFASSDQGSPLKTNCSCEPGYEGTDGGICGRCSTDFYCPGGEDEIQCPLYPIQGSVEQSTSVYNCTCEVGYEGPAGINCSLCSGGFYCPGAGQVTECPTNSRSLEGGGNLRACFCKDGYDGPVGSACDLCPRGKWCSGGTTVHFDPPAVLTRAVGSPSTDLAYGAASATVRRTRTQSLGHRSSQTASASRGTAVRQGAPASGAGKARTALRGRSTRARRILSLRPLAGGLRCDSAFVGARDMRCLVLTFCGRA